MARNRFTRWLEIRWDKDAARRMQDEAESSLAKTGTAAAGEFEGAMRVGGQKGARALTTHLQREYKLRMARLSQQLAEGAINERAFRREGEKAAAAFNAGLSSGIKRLQASTGGLTDAQFSGLGSRFKPAGGGAVVAGMGRSLLAPLAGFYTAQSAARGGLNQVREAIEASDELENSVRKLGGTAKITGLNLADLEAASAKVRSDFNLSIPIANDLTTEVSKLAAKAGDVAQTGAALEAFLNIGAARGMSAQQTLQAVGQAILGIDEGTDKLFSKNPSTIYEEWANRIGRTAESLSDQEKAQALLDATLNAGALTRGEYLKWTESTAGKSAEAAQQIREMQAEMGKAITPIRLLGLELKVSVYEWLGKIIERMGQIRFTPAGKLYFDDGSFARDLELVRRSTMTGPSGVDPELALFYPNGMNPAAGGVTPPGVPTAGQIAAAKKAADAQRINAIGAQGRAGDAAKQLLYGVVPGMTSPGLNTGAPNLGAMSEGGRTPLEQLGDEMMRIDGIASDVAGNVADVWQDAFAAMIEGGGSIGSFFDGMWRGVAASAGRALAELASKEAAKEFAYALSMAAQALGLGAIGNFPGAAAATGSVQGHLAAALAWSALAGGASAGAGAVRTRSPGSTYDAGLSIGRDGATSRERLGPEIHIYVDGIDPRNPDHQRLTYQTLADAKERFGEDAKIVYHPRNAA